jgi:hypothetical protein
MGDVDWHVRVDVERAQPPRPLCVLLSLRHKDSWWGGGMGGGLFDSDLGRRNGRSNWVPVERALWVCDRCLLLLLVFKSVVCADY